MPARKLRKHKGVPVTDEERAEVALTRLETALSSLFQSVPYSSDHSLRLAACKARFDEWQAIMRTIRRKRFESYRPQFLSVGDLLPEEVQDEPDDPIDGGQVFTGS